MLTEERKQEIIKMIEEKGIVRIDQLADMFNVSIYTIRRDLSDLEKKGLIKKTHGGALKSEKSIWLPTIEEGKKEAYEEKKAIALKASSYIEDGDSIFLIGSTITNMMIPHLSNKKLTIVTNSLDVGMSLSRFDNIETILIGGRVKNYKGNILGSKAVEEINNYFFDKSFIPCGGIHYKAGITTSTIDSADFIKAVINCSRNKILIADYRKIGMITFSKICDVNQINKIITDNKVDKKELYEISKLKVEIDIVNVD